MKKSKFSEEKIVCILKEALLDTATVLEVSRKHGITNTTILSTKDILHINGN